jgi:hypothetical protein
MWVQLAPSYYKCYIRVQISSNLALLAAPLVHQMLIFETIFKICVNFLTIAAGLLEPENNYNNINNYNITLLCFPHVQYSFLRGGSADDDDDDGALLLSL